MRRDDACALMLLMTAGCVVAGFALLPAGMVGEVTLIRIVNYARSWQTLLAATLALGGAAAVYRGASLSYAAASERVRFDKETSDRAELRKEIGVCLRLEYALAVLAHEVKFWDTAMNDHTSSHKDDEKINEIDLAFTTENDLTEAWDNLNVFPPATARMVSGLRLRLYNCSLLRNRVRNSNGIDVKTLRSETYKGARHNIAQLKDQLAVLQRSTKQHTQRLHDMFETIRTSAY